MSWPNFYESIRMTATSDLAPLAVYAPFAWDVHLTLSLDGYDICCTIFPAYWLNPELVTGKGR